MKDISQKWLERPSPSASFHKKSSILWPQRKWGMPPKWPWNGDDEALNGHQIMAIMGIMKIKHQEPGM